MNILQLKLNSVSFFLNFFLSVTLLPRIKLRFVSSDEGSIYVSIHDALTYLAKVYGSMQFYFAF